MTTRASFPELAVHDGATPPSSPETLSDQPLGTVIRVGGTTTAADFTMSSYLLGSYNYSLVYLQDYSGTDDGFFLQSAFVSPGCTVTTGDDACFIDSTTTITSTDALAGQDTLQLTGSTNFSFNVGNIGTTYTNFESFQKAGTSVVTLTGTTSDASLGVDVVAPDLDPEQRRLAAGSQAAGLRHAETDLDRPLLRAGGARQSKHRRCSDRGRTKQGSAIHVSSFDITLLDGAHYTD
mgnify:CR=1 FL=1